MSLIAVIDCCRRISHSNGFAVIYSELGIQKLPYSLPIAFGQQILTLFLQLAEPMLFSGARG